jgi:hypothetical protein
MQFSTDHQADIWAMTEQDPQGEPQQLVGVGPEPAPDDVDTSPRPEDGDQDVDQTPDFETAESDDNEEDDDPEVHEVA